MSQDPVVPPQDEPGGPDALEHEDGPGGPLGRDLPPEDNPAVDDILPEEVAEPDEEKQQEPDTGVSGEAGAGDGTVTEPPA